jgi:hypothetical protein
MSEQLSEIPFSSQMAQRVADDERLTIKAKVAGARLIVAVLSADPSSLPETVRNARAELLKLSDELK